MAGKKPSKIFELMLDSNKSLKQMFFRKIILSDMILRTQLPNIGKNHKDFDPPNFLCKSFKSKRLIEQMV
jgi:hypothetical protein